MGVAQAETYDGSTPLANAKHEAFCNEYMIDSNGTRAAISVGYSTKTAAVIATENLRKPKIAARMAYLQDEKNKRARKTADDIRERLENIAFTDITDILSFNESGATFIKPSAEIDPKHAAAIESIGFKEDNVGVSFKLKKIDPVKALNMLGKEVGMFADKVLHGGSVAHTVEVVSYADSKPSKD